ncbi:hypothetical protein LJC45_03785 [Alistipes sp. OttesenSCG-928-B03]|nr:hypothetical protein [Alistipes sp. OttesenSCG-928-B03]
MKRSIIYIALFFVLLSAASCSVQEIPVLENGETLEMSISTRALSASVPVRIMVTEAANGKVILNAYPVSPDNTSQQYRVRLHEGEYNFFVIGNETDYMTHSLNSIRNESELSRQYLMAEDLPLVESPSTSDLKASNIPLFGKTRAMVRGSADGKGEASVDGGDNWGTSLNIALDRLASKLHLIIYKQTPDTNDEVVIRKIEVENVPGYAYMLPEIYDGWPDTHCPWEVAGGYTFSQNTTYPVIFFDHYIIPEYLMYEPRNVDEAVTIVVYAEYNGRSVTYRMPVRSSNTATDYSLLRNNSYLVAATIKTDGGSGGGAYTPELRYEVAAWDDAIDQSVLIEAKNIRFNSYWAAGTIVDTQQRKVYVRNNGVLEFYFKLNSPQNVSWSATITNPIDFMLDDTGGAVSFGHGGTGQLCKIRIKPRKETLLNDLRTEFFITVSDAAGNVELNLPENKTGAGNRYTIIQVPN